MVCAGKGIVSAIAPSAGQAPRVLARFDTGRAGINTVGVDESTGDVWVVWFDAKGDWVQRLRLHS